MDTLWCSDLGGPTTALYLQSGQFSSTIKTSFATGSYTLNTGGISTDDTDTWFCSYTTDKMYKLSGVFTSTLKDSLYVGLTEINIFGIGFNGTDTLWGGGTSDKLFLQSGSFSSTLKTSQYMGGIDNSIYDCGASEGNTVWSGSQADKLYLQSGQITSTLKTSLLVSGIGTWPSAVAFDGTNTPWADSSTDKLYLQSGQFSPVIKDSLSIGFNIQGIESYTSALAPTIDSQTDSVAVDYEGSTSLSVTVSGTAPFTYQWAEDGAAMGGETSSTLSLSTITSDHTYICTVTNAVGSVDSDPIPVVINPTGLEVSKLLSHSVYDSLVNISSSNWYAQVFTPVTNITLSDILIKARKDSSGTVDNVVVSIYAVDGSSKPTGSPLGSVSFAASSLPKFPNDPVDKIVSFSTLVELDAATEYALVISKDASGGVSLGVDSGATYVDPAFLTFNSGVDWSSSTANAYFQIWGTAAPVIFSQTVSDTVAYGASTTLSVTAHGATPLTYQWKEDGSPMSGETASTLSLSSITTQHSYVCSVTNGSGTLDSDAIPVYVLPGIVSQSGNTELMTGAPISLEVTAGGSTPFIYQWYLDGSPLVGETSSTYTKAAAGSSDFGTYNCVVSNAYGSVSSSNIVLTRITMGHTVSLFDLVIDIDRETA